MAPSPHLLRREKQNNKQHLLYQQKLALLKKKQILSDVSLNDTASSGICMIQLVLPYMLLCLTTMCMGSSYEYEYRYRHFNVFQALVASFQVGNFEFSPWGILVSNSRTHISSAFSSASSVGCEICCSTVTFTVSKL